MRYVDESRDGISRRFDARRLHVPLSHVCAKPHLGLIDIVEAQCQTLTGLEVLAPVGLETRGIDDPQLREHGTLECGVENRARRPSKLLAHVLRGDTGARWPRSEE